MSIKTSLISALQQASNIEDIQISFSDTPEHGDYSTNVAMRMGKNPREAAEEVKSKLILDPEVTKTISQIEIAGPGFLNFFVNKEALLEEVNSIILQKDLYGKNNEPPKDTIIVEYSSPNIAKPFTIGHFRSTIIGDAVANLLEANGKKVFRDNHLGDWGTQFGKQIYAIKTWGNEHEIETSENPVKELVSLYVKFHEEAEKNPQLDDEARAWFKKLESGDAEARRIWQKCIDWSWKEFDSIYKKLGVRFTENNGKGYGESFFEDKMQVVIDELEKNNLLTNGDDGARLVFFEGEKYPPLMIVKKDGASLYSTRDLAADKWRLETYGKDTVIINEVGGEQTLYFNQLYEVEKMLGWITENQRIHIRHGLFRFKDKKMSTRKGNVIWLKEVISLAEEKAQGLGEQNSDINEKIAIGALRWNELKRDSVGDIVFDWDEILNMKGNSGPYMQYTVVRAKSILNKSEVKEHQFGILSEEDMPLTRMLLRYSDVVKSAGESYSPSTLSTYLYELAQLFNGYYDQVKIIGSENESHKIALITAVEIVLTNGLLLLGIQVPEKM